MSEFWVQGSVKIVNTKDLNECRSRTCDKFWGDRQQLIIIGVINSQGIHLTRRNEVIKNHRGRTKVSKQESKVESSDPAGLSRVWADLDDIVQSRGWKNRELRL